MNFLATATLVAALASPEPQLPASLPGAQPVPTIAPATSPAPSESGIPASSPPAGGSPAPAASPASVPNASATLAPEAYKYRFIPHQPATVTAGQPQIFAIYINDMHLHSHQPIIIRVETNAAVVKVESTSNGRSGTIPMVAPKTFFASSKLPSIPFIASGMQTDLIFTGTSADGRKVVVHVPVSLE